MPVVGLNELQRIHLDRLRAVPEQIVVTIYWNNIWDNFCSNACHNLCNNFWFDFLADVVPNQLAEMSLEEAFVTITEQHVSLLTEKNENLPSPPTPLPKGEGAPSRR